ncbi:unannotated protein [freshwater metagenome]|uniref:Unannotated protein n=1 Tax=freshwater metagenome TaxID=449393 RepID=A0A6J7KHJ5_9ZZZZ
MSTSPAPRADDHDDRTAAPAAGHARVRGVPGPVAALRAPLPADPLEALAAVRERTRILVGDLTRDELERQVDPLMSPLVWDLAHIAAYEDLWLVHRHGDRPLLHPELAALYDAFETPRRARGDLELLDVPQAWAYLDEVRARVHDVVGERGVDPELFELVLQHELQHTETMLQAMRLGGLTEWLDTLPGGARVAASRAAGTPGEDPADAPVASVALVDVPGGPVEVGAADGVFSYDNERPRHGRSIPAFRIATRPVTVALWDAFVADGGVRDQRFWSDAGWAWRAGGAGSAVHDATGDGGSATGPPAARAEATPTHDVACHLNLYEAEALAAWAGLRLPTEAEWEHAAASGLLDDVGHVWEWTSTVFHGYPGFAAHPYKEYSEVFFDREYRVLRGGSFAAHPRVATPTFRNWDLPERRQIFSGVRLAADAPGPDDDPVAPAPAPGSSATGGSPVPPPAPAAPTGREATT